jgi:hypothetical protein
VVLRAVAAMQGKEGLMGRVLEFARPERATRPRRPADGMPMGQILLFTGVRYERFPDPPRPQEGPAGRTRSRRRGN